MVRMPQLQCDSAEQTNTALGSLGSGDGPANTAALAARGSLAALFFRILWNATFLDAKKIQFQIVNFRFFEIFEKHKI